jgi:hypothetical protein
VPQIPRQSIAESGATGMGDITVPSSVSKTSAKESNSADQFARRNGIQGPFANSPFPGTLDASTGGSQFLARLSVSLPYRVRGLVAIKLFVDENK